MEALTAPLDSFGEGKSGEMQITVNIHFNDHDHNN